jgi:hypothetical protein
MGRVMTLRGEFLTSFGTATTYGLVNGKLLFEYESPDRTRGWKVRYAAVWCQEATQGTSGGDARALWQGCLSTDQIGRIQSKITDGATARRYQSAIGAGDNRTIGWWTQDMLIRDATSADWIAPHGATQRAPTELIIDVDRIITNELYIMTYGVTEGSTITDLVANYYIELEEVKLTPSGSVFQQLKGIGQEADHEAGGFPQS